ncbi:stage III sporulation protein AA [Thermincola ferriacetica]
MARQTVLYQEIMEMVPGNLRAILARVPNELMRRAEEIRLRQNRPLIIGHDGGDLFLTPEGEPTVDITQSYTVTGEDLKKTANLLSNSSIYAVEEEVRNGFITVPGGHRVGLAGRVIIDNGKVKTIKYITSLNIRIAREVIGASDNIMPYLIDPIRKEFQHTLIISPPRCGKTTLLRDIVRQLSNGVPSLGFHGVPVGVVDERSEIAGCFRGVPQKDVGIRTDVLDGCPKAEGMIMLIRSMAPKVVATDEIGRKEDIFALEEVLNAGIKILTTVHGANLSELVQRPALKYLVEQGIFERYIVLNREKGVGTVEDILDGKTRQSLKR